jgi:hypothetical protein
MKDEPMKPDMVQKIIDFKKNEKEFWDKLKKVDDKN